MLLADNPAVLLLHCSLKSWGDPPYELGVMLVLFLFFEILLSRFTHKWKIQNTVTWDWRVVGHEIVFALFVQYMVGFVLDIALSYCEAMGWIFFTYYDDRPFLFAFQTVYILLALDLWFYIAHKSMHDIPWLYHHVHKIHHRSLAPTVLTSLSFSPLETLLISSGLLVVLCTIGRVYGGSVAIAGFYITAYNLAVHLGFEIFPRWWNSNAVSKQFLCVTFHDDHHSKFNYNYGLFLTIWDRLFGTLYPKFDEIYTERWSKSKKSEKEKLEKKNA